MVDLARKSPSETMAWTKRHFEGEGLERFRENLAILPLWSVSIRYR